MPAAMVFLILAPLVYIKIVAVKFVTESKHNECNIPYILSYHIDILSYFMTAKLYRKFFSIIYNL